MTKEKQRYEYKLTLGKHPITGEVIRVDGGYAM